MKGKEKTEELQKELLRIKEKIEEKMGGNEPAPFTMDPSYFELMRHHHKRIEKINDKFFANWSQNDRWETIVDKINEIIDIVNSL